MRIYIDLVTGECSLEYPMRPGQVRQEVKALRGERLEIRWLKHGAAYEMPEGTELKMSVYDEPGGTKLAELTSLTAPDDVSTGFYEGRLSFNTDPVLAMLTAAPTKDSFAATASLLWKIPDVDDWEESDDIRLDIRRATNNGDTPVELDDSWTWLKARTAAGTNITFSDNETTKVRTINASVAAAAHASSHTDGTDDIQSATASQKGLATAAQIAKLDGIEAGADVTDAANIATAIDGATAKTTPVDADTVPLIDSAASSVLKKLSWANIKATLKTYFDEIYGIIAQNSQSADYTLVLSDAGKHIYHPGADTTARTWTIPANASVAFPIGTAVTFVNDTSAGVITIAITSDTLVLAGSGTTGSRTLAANGMATAVKVTSTRWIISGSGLT